MGRSILLIVAAVVVLALAAEAVKPSAWRLLESRKPSASDRISFTFALKQQNMDILEKTVLEISDPTNAKYSQWLSKDEILDLIAPAPHVPLKYIAWVESECAAYPLKIDNLRDAVKVETTVACAEKLLNIKTVYYQHKKSGVAVVRRHLEGSLPTVREDLAAHLEFVSGISQLPVMRERKTEPLDAARGTAALDYVIPATSRTLYNIPAGAKATNPRNSQSAIEFTPEGAPMISDMVAFAQQSGEVFTNISKIVGPFDVGNNGESILDVEYLTTLGTGAFTWYITIEGWIYDFALTLFNTPNPPLVNSVSYGWPEEDQCNTVVNSNCTGITTGQYVAKANNELLKVAGLGLSVLVASQDEGAPSEANEDCSLDDSHPLWPIYPAASPWVTSVSGTTLIGGSDLNNAPSICNQGYTCGSGSGAIEHPCMPNETYYQWTTGGGFSKYAPRPSWQSAAVSKYLTSSALIPPSQWFMAGNRGYPDISGLGARILTIQSGSLAVTAGTSAATPIIAGIITLLNDYRLNAGKKQLGFLNPMLYQAKAANAATFNVINAGNNKGTIGTTCTYGYGCWNGWSPVTGLGSPNYAQLLNYIKSLP